MIGKSELTQALALTIREAMATMPQGSGVQTWEYGPYRPRRGKYGRNPNRTCKLLRRIKTTC